jgi:hypothetical protein
MEKTLVEIYVHGGLLDTLEIEWRGMVITQRLDYLGVPFRFSRCRQTGHLKKDCRLPFGVHSDEPHSDDTITHGYSLEVETLEQVKYPGARDLDYSPPSTTTFVGNLRHYVPSLYCSLTAWEKDHLDSFFSAFSNDTGASDTSEMRVSGPEVNIILTESDVSPLDSKVVECTTYSSSTESLHKTKNDQPNLLLSEDSPLLPSYGELDLSDHSLDKMLTDLVPTFREVNSLVTIPIFLRRTEVAAGEPGNMEPDPLVSEASNGNSLAWSQGLGLEISPVKTRSAHKKVGSTHSNLLALEVTSRLCWR